MCFSPRRSFRAGASLAVSEAAARRSDWDLAGALDGMRRRTPLLTGL